MKKLRSVTKGTRKELMWCNLCTIRINDPTNLGPLFPAPLICVTNISALRNQCNGFLLLLLGHFDPWFHIRRTKRKLGSVSSDNRCLTNCQSPILGFSSLDCVFKPKVTIFGRGGEEPDWELEDTPTYTCDLHPSMLLAADYALSSIWL